MQKIALMVVISGTLIVGGLILLALGNQVILDEINQGNGIVSINQDVIISTNFDSQETSIGIFAIQVMDIEENILSVKILDPLNIEIDSLDVFDETTEKTFDILETGEYKLIIQSTSDEEIQVFGAIGPLPDEGKKSISYISVLVLIIGMIGLIGSTILKIKNRK
tara:strand:- start:659 stop:1153 length:495 start_codon:yes stop_codon:yes gene_type:complete